jgi:hypothetical protein
MSAFKTLREVNDRLSADDAPLWAEALGLILVLGFYLRDLAHIIAALAANEHPELRDNDVSMKSPVEALDGEPLADMSGRLLAVGMGVGVVWMAMESSRLPVQAYLLSNALVPLTDILLFWAAYNT